MKNKINKGTGAGGAKTNANGIKFEENIYLKQWIEDKNYSLTSIDDGNRSNLFEIRSVEGSLIAYYGRQSKLYAALKIANLVNREKVKKVMSKEIRPDGFILNVVSKELTIFEKKWQQSSGSVDEKIQTAPFKIFMFERLLEGTGYKVKYEYILSDWFAKKAYENIRDYYSDNKKVKLWIEGKNLKELDVNDYLK